jgi:hypothetical protein
MSEDENYTGAIALDQTMKHIINMIEFVDPSFNGTLDLTNLFNLRCGNIKKEVKLYAELKKERLLQPLLETDFEKLLINYQYRFAWLGWSLKKKNELNEQKRNLKEIIQSSLPTVAKYKNDNPKEIHVWHFKPLLKTAADEYAEFIIPQLKKFLPYLNSHESTNQNILTKQP